MGTEMPVQQPGRRRSWFWPVILISVGVIWLLRNFDILGNANITMLLRLWPLLLIAIGFDLIFARRSPRMGTYLALGTAGLAVVLMIVGPVLGWGKVDVKHAAYSEPKGSATTAQIKLEFGVGTANINTVTDSDSLFTADVTYVGELRYTATGSVIKTIDLGQASGNVNFGIGNWPADDSLNWNIRLSKDIPLAMTVNTGVGDAILNFGDMQLTSLNVDAGVGRVNLKLPAVKNTYRVELNSGVGSTEITLKQESAVDLFINGGVGSVLINIPAEAAVRIEKANGVAGINLPSHFVMTTGANGESQSAWETPNYKSSEKRITIVFSGGLGGLTVRT